MPLNPVNAPESSGIRVIYYSGIKASLSCSGSRETVTLKQLQMICILLLLCSIINLINLQLKSTCH